MGQLVDGVWQVKPLLDGASSKSGQFRRQASQFRNWITADGPPGSTGDGGFKAEPDRYHLYVSLACPWAHRTLIMRAFKGLEGMIDVSVVHWHMADKGWSFDPGAGVVPDPIHGAAYMHQVYTAAAPDYTGRVTVPVLWDKTGFTIVSNESADIIRMLNSAFDGIGAKDGDYYPVELRSEIDRINTRVYDAINNGVYKCGFARSQAAYDEAADALFAELDAVEQILSGRRYLAGDRMTEADIRLFTTLIRFDPVYHVHFKCSRKRLIDYPNLFGFTRELFQMPGVGATVNFAHIREHYYGSHLSVNPTGIVAQMPTVDLEAPHRRGD